MSIELRTALQREFYARDPIHVARDLLGTLLVHRTDATLRVGRIVEVEAYLGPRDLAAHSSRGLTARTRVLFGPPGYAYVYLIYGLHCCMNVVTGDEDGSAVLLRALEPVTGLTDRTSGPGRLCRAMGIDRRLNGADLTHGELVLAPRPDDRPFRIARTARVGVGYSGPWARRLLRFCIQGNPFVSRP